MERKYYTPTIEEFHVGFKFQVLSQDGNRTEDEDWSNQFLGYETIYDFNEESWGENIECYLVLNAIRVKLLDKEDIESLGWKRYATIENYYSLNKHSMWFYSNKKIVKISVSVDYEFEETGFQGVIKNKSELRKLMIQLNIK